MSTMSAPDTSSSFPSCSRSASYLVGTLSTWNPQARASSNPLAIYSNEEIYIGRDGKKCQYIIENPFISNKHLRIYTIIFDRENPQEVAPLVYAQDLSMNGTLWNDLPMGKGSGSFLLSDGDVLRLSPGFFLRFCCVGRGDGCFDVVQRMEMEVFQDQYFITPRKLGSGAYGQVHMAIDKENSRQLACKIVDLRVVRQRIEKLEELKRQSKSKFFDNDGGQPSIQIDKNGTAKLVAIRQMRNSVSRNIQEKLKVYDREARILEKLCHPNIISLAKVIKTSNTIYLFQDLVTAGDLFSFIEYKGGKLGDIEAAVIIRQVLMALDYLHDRNIVHRDLKPDNILMTSLADGCRVVLTDFGCARLVRPNIERMSTVVGTFEYSAPEVIKSSRRGYTKAVDLWSLGCVTAVLLTGGSPFMDPSTAMYSEELAQKCDLERLEADTDWNRAGKRAKDFVRRLLVLDETKRMDVKQALRHCWFTNPVYTRELEELYKRSIRDWKPRVHRGPLVVDLGDLRSDGNGIQRDKLTGLLDSPCGLCVDVDRIDQRSGPSSTFSDSDTCSDLNLGCETSSIPPSDWELESCGFHEDFSPTLSDPELPTLSRFGGKAMNKDPNGSQSLQEGNSQTDPDPISKMNQSPPEMRLPFSPDAWVKNEPIDSRPSIRGKNDQYSNRTANEPKALGVHGIPSWCTEHPQLPTDSGSRARFLPTKDNGDPTIPTLTGKKRRKWSSGNFNDDFEDEVYEEVDNLVTGKRQHIIYGTNILAGEVTA